MRHGCLTDIAGYDSVPRPSATKRWTDRKTWIAIPLFVDVSAMRQSADFFVFFCLLVRGCRHQALEQGHDSPFRFLEKTLGLLEGDLPGRCEPGRFLKHDVEGRLVDEVLAYFFAPGFLVEGLDCDSQVVAFLPEVVHLVFPTFIVGGIDFEFGMQMDRGGGPTSFVSSRRRENRGYR